MKHDVFLPPHPLKNTNDSRFKKKKHFEKESIHLNPKTTIQISQQQSFESIVNPPSTIEKLTKCDISKQGSIFGDDPCKYFICWLVHGFAEFRGKYLTPWIWKKIIHCLVSNLIVENCQFQKKQGDFRWLWETPNFKGVPGWWILYFDQFVA